MSGATQKAVIVSTGTDFAAYLAVFAGSAIGGVLRWLVSVLMGGFAGDAFPWATLLVNVAGSFAIGLYAALTEPGGRLIAGPRMRLFVMIGVCGGFTTFSAFSLETVRLLQAGRETSAAIYVSVTVIASVLAAWMGEEAAMRLNRRGAR